MSFTLSLNLTQHDSSVAVFKDDELIFFNHAERYTRKKHDSVLSIDVIQYILNKITNSIDILVIGSQESENSHVIEFIKSNFEIKKIIFSQNVSEEYQKIIQENRIDPLTHHSSHALSAFYMSPFDQAVCLIVDAVGSPYMIPDAQEVRKKNESVCGIRGNETTSIIEVSKNYSIRNLYKRSQALPILATPTSDGVLPVSHIGAELQSFGLPGKRFKTSKFVFDSSTHVDIGMMYETISLHLGFGIHGSGKVMGLSAYGKDDPTIPPFLVDNSIYSNNNLFVLGRELNYTLYPKLFTELSPNKRANLAYAAQKALERVFLHHVEFIRNNSRIRNLIIGGGCALNILAVSLIKKHYPEFNIFVDPIADDATHAIGEGIHFYNVLGTNCTLEKKNKFESIYLGPKYDESSMHSDIDSYINQC